VEAGEVGAGDAVTPMMEAEAAEAESVSVLVPPVESPEIESFAVEPVVAGPTVVELPAVEPPATAPLAHQPIPIVLALLPPSPSPRIPKRYLLSAALTLTTGLALAAVSIAASQGGTPKAPPPSAAQLQDEAARAVWRTAPVDSILPPTLNLLAVVFGKILTLCFCGRCDAARRTAILSASARSP